MSTATTVPVPQGHSNHFPDPFAFQEVCRRPVCRLFDHFCREARLADPEGLELWKHRSAFLFRLWTAARDADSQSGALFESQTGL